MRYYVRGEIIATRSRFKGSIPHATIDGALDEARQRTALKSAVIWIVDQDENMVLDSNAVIEKLRARK